MPIRFIDLKENNDAERATQGIAPPSNPQDAAARGPALGLSTADALWLMVDPLFIAVRDDVDPAQAVSHFDGIMVMSGQSPLDMALSPLETEVAAVYGILLRNNVTSTDDRRFFDELARARGEYKRLRNLYARTLPVLVDEGDQQTLTPAGTAAGAPAATLATASIRPAVTAIPISDVRATEWAGVVQTLAQQGVSPQDIHLALKTREALSTRIGADDKAPPSSIEIDLPDLDNQVEAEIVKANLDAMQAMYFAASCEQLGMFAVMDKIVELFHEGMLPLGKGRGGDLLYRYWKKGVDRFTEVERRNLYARSFGYPGGEATQGTPNREFTDLWLRFVSAASEFSRQSTVDRMFRANVPANVSVELVRKAGRDLAANLSLYGFGVAYFAATELQNQIREVIEILGESEIQSAFGARDMWQVVDQVSALELGGAKNSVRYRTMAQTGAVIIRWLSTKAAQLTTAGGRDLIDPAALTGQLAPSAKPMRDANDRDLLDACEQWLAVTGTAEGRIEEFSQPVEGPTTTSRPIAIPAVARDLLESVGVSANSYARN